MAIAPRFSDTTIELRGNASPLEAARVCRSGEGGESARKPIATKRGNPQYRF